MDSFIPYGQHWVDDDDIAAVISSLRSGWLTTGPTIAHFEQALAERCGAHYAVAVSSGTAALHAAYYAAGVSGGDEVITSPVTFAATSNAALYLGGKPVFADVDRQTVLLDPGQAEKKIGPRTKVLAPVDFGGQPADIDAFMRLAEEHNLTVVEDAAHSLGASVSGRPVGSLAHMTILSFHPVKHITTGEGGAVLTDDSLLYKRLVSFRTHGMVYGQAGHMFETEGPWYHEQQALGFNYRVTDFQCALGLSQLKKLDRFLERRREIAAIYNRMFAEVPNLELPSVRGNVEHAWHIYTLRLRGTPRSRRLVFEGLRGRGLGVQVHYIPVYHHPLYRELGYFDKAAYPNAEDYYGRCITIPLFPAMNDAQVDNVIKAVKEVAEEFAS